MSDLYFLKTCLVVLLALLVALVILWMYEGVKAQRYHDEACAWRLEYAQSDSARVYLTDPHCEHLP